VKVTVIEDEPPGAPTDLPEGGVVELFSRDHVLAAGGDFLDDDERAALHRELEASILEADNGQTEDFSKALAELRQRASL